MSPIYGKNAQVSIRPRKVLQVPIEEEKPCINVEETRKLQDKSVRNEIELQQLAGYGRAKVYLDNIRNLGIKLKPEVYESGVPTPDPIRDGKNIRQKVVVVENPFACEARKPTSLDDALSIVGYKIDDLDDLNEKGLYAEPSMKTFKEIAAEKELQKMGL